MKKRVTRLVASTLTAGLVLSGMPIYANATETKPAPSEDDYELVWNDEFDGDSLNTGEWNVEAHNPGWVNAELQRYVDEDEIKNSTDNIEVSDGILKIKPVAEKKASDEEGLDVFDGNGIDSTWGGYGYDSVDVSGGTAVIKVSNAGEWPWSVQFQKSGLTLEEGHTYKLVLKAKAEAARKIELNIANTIDYSSFGGTACELGTEFTEYTCEFTMGECEEKKVAVQVNLGNYNGANDATTVTLSDVKLIDLTETEAAQSVAESGEEGSQSKFNYKGYNYTSGRINTKGKEDFTYGKFVCSARVPQGMGYLPAFWLMASDENIYGQWPKCGEMDIMEVMGQQTDKSYHTIHYGYKPKEGHRENQGIYTIESGDDYYEAFHEYELEWLPGELIWRVDGNEVYRTNDWFTGKDEDSHITYPAPFDQDFYIILNLAIGGEWVGYPDEAAVNDMANQSYDIDYVRVYRLPDEEYKKLEEEVVAPERVINYREADSEGNYVVNGNFAADLKPADSEGDNFELHVEGDAKGSSAKVQNNSVVITPAAAGQQNHSVQLKQTGIPIRKDWTYTLSFDACSTENRSIIVDIEGPDKGWTRYFEDTKVDITKEKKTYTYDFTMNEKSDANGSLEFNLGKQGSTAPVTISNVSLKVKEEGPEEDIIEKTVRPDGNYVYNGAFDQGDKRLGYWEIAEDDKAAVTVTNENMVRELSVKVEVPEGTTALNPVTLYQGDLEPLVKGTYDISFDAYMGEDGDANGITVTASGISFTPNITTERKNYSKQFKLRKDLSREDSDIKIEFTKPGTYFLDNVMLIESAILKNGFFDSGLTGYDLYYNSPAVASGMVDNMNGNDNTVVVSIDDTGVEGTDVDRTWYIQLIQDGIYLENGKSYELSFDIRSTVPRLVKYGLECNGNLDNPANGAWENYNGSDDPIEITTEWKRVTSSFTMKHNTDPQTRFKIAMGDFGEELEKHDVYIDNIVLKETGSVLTPDEQAEKDEADKAAADPVIAAIKALGEVEPEFTDEYKAQLDEVENAYNALTIDQQDMVPDEVYDILYNAKQSYKALVNAAAEQKEEDDNKEEDKQEETKTEDKKEETKSEDKKEEQKSDDKKEEQKSDDKKGEKKEETKPSNEWIDGKWYNADGSQSYEGIGVWKSDASGWWFEDSSGWYPKNEWQKIDGKWYFFTEDGYMDYGEYRDGCWLGDDGAWVEDYSGGHWMSDGSGWWYEDNGWYPASQYLWIDGVKYWFNAKGYWEE